MDNPLVTDTEAGPLLTRADSIVHGCPIRTVSLEACHRFHRPLLRTGSLMMQLEASIPTVNLERWRVWTVHRRLLSKGRLGPSWSMRDRVSTPRTTQARRPGMLSRRTRLHRTFKSSSCWTVLLVIDIWMMWSILSLADYSMSTTTIFLGCMGSPKHFFPLIPSNMILSLSHVCPAR